MIRLGTFSEVVVRGVSVAVLAGSVVGIAAGAALRRSAYREASSASSDEVDLRTKRDFEFGERTRDWISWRVT